MCYIFFIYSIVNEHLRCFHVLATVNSFAMKTGVPWIFLHYGCVWVYAPLPGSNLYLTPFVIESCAGLLTALPNFFEFSSQAAGIFLKYS